MSAASERWREAARLMRERAEAAKGFDREWFAATDDEHDVARVWLTDVVTGDPVHVLTADSPADPEPNFGLAEHIAGWRPAVALAVATWLVTVAHDAEISERAGRGTDTSYAMSLVVGQRAHATAVADAYLTERTT